jgi:hypothetical protein
VNKYKKIIAIIAFFTLTHGTYVHSQETQDVQYAHFPMLNGIAKIVSNHALKSTCLLLATFAGWQYYMHRKNPAVADISPEAKIRRQNEILQGNHSIYEKLKLIISFINDFYIFGARTKKLVKKKIVQLDTLTKEEFEEKVIVRQGTGPITFLRDNVFDGLDEIIKTVGVLAAAFVVLDATLAGDLAHLLITGAKVTDGKIQKTLASTNTK